MIRKLCQIWIILLAGIMISGCNGAKHLATGETLYKGPNLVIIKKKETPTKFKLEDRADKRVEVWMETLKNPNGAFMGIPFIRFVPLRLFMYNWFYTEKESGFSHWMMVNFGEPPITVEQVHPEVRVNNAKAVLFAYGHFNADGGYTLKYNRKKTKARVHYWFAIGPAFTISSLESKIAHGPLQKIIDQHLQETKIEIGETFNLQKIEKDREALVIKLQNQGYFYLNKENILLLADTTGGNRTVQLRYELDRNLPQYKTIPSTIENISIVFDNETKPGTIQLGKDTGSSKDYELKYNLLDAAIELDPGSTFSQSMANRSVANLSSTNVLSGMTMKYNVHPGDSTKLDAVITLKPADRFGISLDGAVTTKTSHFAGPAIGFKFTQKNLFGGAENMTYGVDAFLDFPTGILRKTASISTGIGVSTDLTYPLKKPVFNLLAKKTVQGMPKGILTLAIDINNRRDYFRMVNFIASYGISWKSSPFITHRLDFTRINYNNLLETTPVFDSIRSANIQIQQSFEDRFFIGPHYALVFNNTSRDKISNFYAKLDVDFSGNILNGLQSAVGYGEESSRTFLGLSYAQYTILSADLRHYYNFGYEQSLIFRLVPSVGFSYGNSNYLPYIKQFYVGGSNSLRPFSARTIGPGTYLPSLAEFEDDNFIINNSGDIVVQGNIEYRFPILYKLKGAVWSDYGNVYLSEPDPLRPGGEFEWATFIEKMIVTAGVGLRLDFDYLVLRADWGVILYYPWFPSPYKWVWQVARLSSDIPNGFTIALGYPF